MKDKNLVKSLVIIGSCVAVFSTVLIKRKKITKKVNKIFNKKIKPQIQAIVEKISNEAIAIRAYEIFKSGTGGSQEENWFRAEKELFKKK